MSTMDRSHCQSFEISLLAREDGSLQAAYVSLHDGVTARTETILPQSILLDRDESNRVLGIEILTPVTLETLLQVASHLEMVDQAAFRNFIEKYAPPSLLKSA